MLKQVVLAGALGFGLLAVGAHAQSLPDWAAPTAPQAYDVPQSPPSQEVGPVPPPAPDQVPIDGGLGLLALAGGAYAAKKLRRRD